MNNESKVNTAEENFISFLIDHTVLDVNQQDMFRPILIGFMDAYKYHITKLEARNRELWYALETLVSLSGIYEPAKGVSDEGDKVIKAIKIAEQALKLK